MVDEITYDQIFKYCNENNFLDDLIDYYDLEIDYISKYPLNLLAELSDYDAIFLNDDPNWFTVFNELKIIKEMNEEFPLVFICNNIFPHKRRDSYINPEIIPIEFRKDFSKTFDYNNVKLNDGFFHANEENTIKNGVLTAIEDFLKDNMSIGMMDFKLINGITILYPKNSISQLRLSGLSEEIEDCCVDLEILSNATIENHLLTDYIHKFKFLNDTLNNIGDFKEELDKKIK